MDHKFKSLLQNIATRHVITAIAKKDDRKDQIEKLRNLDINNFFILGAVQSIQEVLGKSYWNNVNTDMINNSYITQITRQSSIMIKAF